MKTEKAILAAGCFWGVEELLRTYKGVVSTEVGYCGGDEDEANYKIVKTGTTEHAEAILVEFDSEKLSYRDLIRAFFKLHDPTTKNQQGNDVGRQYRSAIFYYNDEQKLAAEEIKAEVQKSGKWMRPIVTEIVAAAGTPFYAAEDYHQDYLQKNPEGYMCHFWRE
ncbi:peptide-methionine (S)-S-oxide reductase MsrA [bacterium]|nr:peptide-methionine (S)-S-oxide reductase MsrA [bacterium]